ncbi:lipid A deacylase LpxR family protein [Motiliproteus sediminis]|uniref:lipid A deacylase LpxR family protein n=1 Tax=Motiliproteus sediminis TaxID=1468178 RepID=UPI001FE5EE30|nr:lipid A deacylase LpxR family protein [Motiliproteus sediminis]
MAAIIRSFSTETYHAGVSSGCSGVRPMLGGMLLLFSLLGQSAVADCAAPSTVQGREHWVGNLYFENDLFEETDQNYTNGIRVSLISPVLASFTDDPQLAPWIIALNKAMRGVLPGDEGNCLQERRLVFSIGQSIYTPEDINATEVVSDQRPYAGWLYTGVAYNLRRDNRLDTLGLNLGMVGPAALGQETQDFIHELRGFAKFQGWDNQLDNEPGLQLIWEQKRKWGNTRAFGGWGSDLILHGGGSLGNVATYLNAGGEVRLGWNIPDDFGTSALRPGGDNSAPGADYHPSPLDAARLDKLRRGVHLFASLDGRWVLRDIFLDGNSFSDSHSVDKEPLVADLAYGVALVLGDLEISYARILRTKEFTTQPSSHDYGSLSLSWTRLF